MTVLAVGLTLAPITTPVFSCPVSIVVRMRAEAKMAWVDARGVVAGMHQDHAPWNIYAMGNGPSHAMRQRHYFPGSYLSVPPFIEYRLPFPALKGSTDVGLGPEDICQEIARTEGESHET